MAKEVHLTIPISREQAEALEPDDIVYLSGICYSFLYREHHTGLLEALDKGEPYPVDLRDGVAYHTGAIYEKNEDGSYRILSIGSTTSAKFNDLTPALIAKSGVRALIGKGGMDDAVLEAMQEYGCVYLAACGGGSSFYLPAITILEDLLPEEQLDTCNQRLKLRLDHAGPYFVAMDAHGRSVYREVDAETGRRKEQIFRALGISQPEE